MTDLPLNGLADWTRLVRGSTTLDLAPLCKLCCDVDVVLVCRVRDCLRLDVVVDVDDVEVEETRSPL